MAEARDKVQWNHTADLMAHMRNLQRSSDDDKWWTRADFHPYMPKPKMPRSNNVNIL